MLDYSTAKGLGPKQLEAWKMSTDFCGATTMIPNRPQFDFSRAVGSCTKTGHRIFLFTAANGVGKTTLASNLIANIVYGNVNRYNDITDVDTGERFTGYFDYPLFNEFPKTWPKNFWYISNQDLLQAIHREHKNWWPRNDAVDADFWLDEKSGKTYVSHVHFIKPDFHLYYKTIKQDPDTFEGANISIVIFDEPPPKDLYMAAIKRLRMGGIIIIVGTAIIRAGWFMDEIVDKLGDGDKVHQTARIWDNGIDFAGEWDLGLYGVQKKGVLTTENINFQIRNTDPDEYEARIEGKIQKMSGLIFKGYKQEIITEDGERKPYHFTPIVQRDILANYVYRFVMDPHDRKPPACIWARMDRWNRIEIIREWPSWKDEQYNGRKYIDIKDAGIYVVEDFIEFWMQIEAELGIPPGRIEDIIDPNFGMKISRTTGLRLYQEYMLKSQEVAERLGFGRHYSFITNAYDGIPEGHKKVKEWLKPMPSGDLPLVISNECRNLDLAFRRYQWKDDQTSKKEEMDGIKEDVELKYADFIDLVRYLLVVPWTYTAPDKHQSRFTGGDYGEAEPEGHRTGAKGGSDWRTAAKELQAIRPKGAKGV